MQANQLLLLQDRPYFSKVDFVGAGAGQKNVNYFRTAGKDSLTNLDVAGQISNSSDFQIRQLVWKFSPAIANTIAYLDATAMLRLAQAIKGGILTIQVNKIDKWSCAVSALSSTPTDAVVATSIDTRRDLETEGKYIFNEPILVSKGQPLDVSGIYENMPTNSQLYRTEIHLFGFLLVEGTMQAVNTQVQL